MAELYTQFYNYFLAVARWALPVLAILIIYLWIRLLRSRKSEPSAIAALVGEDGKRYPIIYEETSIGRRKNNDIVISLPTVARQQAVLIKEEDGFYICDLSGDDNITVDGERLERDGVLKMGNVISFGGYRTKLSPTRAADFSQKAKKKHKRISPPKTTAMVMLLSIFQLIVGVELCLKYNEDLDIMLPVAFASLIIGEWVCYFVNSALGKSIAVEFAAFFLTTLGFAVCATAAPSTLLKELVASVAGYIVFLILSNVLKNIYLTMKLRYVVGIAGVALLVINLILAQSVFGARNWINLGFVTIQPSEFVKIAFVFAGAASLDRLLTKRNFILFLAMSAAILGSLALMRDFGTASIFFVTMLIILFMRTGDIKLISAILIVAVAAILLIIKIMPYITARFAAWGHVWEFPDDAGYQQTRTMIAIGSGGLLGLGGGNGKLYQVFAADTDLVFGLIIEEWGGIVAICALLVIVMLSVYAVWLSRGITYSSYYAISVTAAAGMLLFQTALNIFGSVDILPLTGVTMPFVSNGGSSIIASWGLLAFFKAADSEIGKQH